MPIEIENFTTEVNLVSSEGSFTAEQKEELIQEVMRRIVLELRHQQRAERNSSLRSSGRVAPLS